MFNYQYFNLMHYFFFCYKPNQMSLRPNYTLAAPPRPLNIDTIWYYIEKKKVTHIRFLNVHFHRCPSRQMNGIAAERFLLRQK